MSGGQNISNRINQYIQIIVLSEQRMKEGIGGSEKVSFHEVILCKKGK